MMDPRLLSFTVGTHDWSILHSQPLLGVLGDRNAKNEVGLAPNRTVCTDGNDGLPDQR
jgi:hypothetical protein